VTYSIHPTAMRGEICTKNCFGSRMLCPSSLTDFNLTYTALNACAGSATWHISVAPLQSEGRYGPKTVSASRLKWPSLLTDFNLYCTARNACARNAMWHITATLLQCEGGYGRKLFRPQKSNVPFITDPLQPNLDCL
jgi:hypothetical protein